MNLLTQSFWKSYTWGYNIDLLKLNVESNRYLDNFLEKEYIPYFKTLTRCTEGVIGSCMNNFFGKSKEISITSNKLVQQLTEHFPLIIIAILILVNIRISWI